MTAIKERKSKKTVGTNSDENVLSMYLSEISHIPLLSREEEAETAKAAAKGNEAARSRLVNVAKKYQGQGLPLADLISEGNVGLINAVDRFDVEKGYHFISYAVWWIRQSILKALCEKSRMIRLPQNRTAELIQIERARKIVQEHRTVEGEIKEIAGLLDMDAEHVQDMINISKDMVSLENPVSSERDSVIGDFIEDERYVSPDQQMLQAILQDDIENVLTSLDKKEAAIIRCRYGLGNGHAMSLKEIGDRFHLTKERIRQIEKKAMVRLQHPTRTEKLASYVA